MTLLRYDVWASRIADGWSGCYSLPGRMCRVRDELGLVRVFCRREEAVLAAYRALIDALNDPAGPVTGPARRVSRQSRWAIAGPAEAAERLSGCLVYGGSGGASDWPQRSSKAVGVA